MTDSRLRELARAMVEGAPPPPPWPDPGSIARPSHAMRPRRVFILAFAVVVVFVIGAGVALRTLDNNRQDVATHPRPLPATDQDCAIRLTAPPAVLCVTSYDANHVSFLISGFKRGTDFEVSTRDGQTSGGATTNVSGTNIDPKAARRKRAAASPGTTVSATGSIFASGAVVTGTAANDASVTFFVPPPANVSHPDASDRAEATPDFVSVVDSTHLELGLSCNPYGPAVQVKTTTKTVRVGAFYDDGSQLDCMTLFAVTLPSPIGTRAVISDVDGSPLTSSECASMASTATVDVPDVIGMTLPDAIAAVKTAGLHVVGHGTPPSDPTDDSAVVTAEKPSGSVPAGACIGFRTTTNH